MVDFFFVSVSTFKILKFTTELMCTMKGCNNIKPLWYDNKTGTSKKSAIGV